MSTLMKSRLLLLPYRTYSGGAKLLKEALGIKFASRRKQTPFPNNKLIINWGSSPKRIPWHRWSVVETNATMLNHPMAVAMASNKLSTLFYLEDGVSIPDYCVKRSTALKWASEGIPVVCRTLLESHSGKGIVIANSPEEVVDAPLYTKYIKKTREVRVHVFNGTIIHVQEKKRNKDVPDEEVNWQVRNKQNGFNYTFRNIKPIAREALRDAIMAPKRLGLDFCAVDMIYNKKEDKWYILELNTAPGLFGTTLDKYVNAIKRMIQK